MNPFYKQSGKKEQCYIYKKVVGKDKELDLDVHRSFLLFRYFNHNIPENNSPMIPISLSDEMMQVVYKCVLLSYLSYKDRSIIEFPPEIKLEYEKNDSTVGRIPFFIVTDSSINAIIVSCRGSSCIDDFITDSMGNGVTYDGGKFHEGVFNTASYVFLSCQNKVIQLNNEYNNESINLQENSENNIEVSSHSNSDNKEAKEEEVVTKKAKKKSKKEEKRKSHSKSQKPPVNDDDNDDNGDEDNKTQTQESTIVLNEKKPTSDIVNSTPVFKTSNNTNLFNKNRPKRTKIIITGHSLGAATAGVVAYLFKKNIPQLDVHCICFAPPPTMSFNLWETTGNYIKSFMIEGDLVPFLSVQNLLHISDIMFPGQTANFAFKRLVHSYLKKKSVEEVQAIAALTETLYPPGQMYLLRFTNDEANDGKNSSDQKKKKDKDKKKKKNKNKKKKDKKNKEKEDNIQMCQILNPDYFSSFVKNIQESNHAVKNYMRMIIRLMNKNKK